MDPFKGQGGIQMLLTAEQEAQHIVSNARNCKIQWFFSLLLSSLSYTNHHFYQEMHHQHSFCHTCTLCYRLKSTWVLSLSLNRTYDLNDLVGSTLILLKRMY